MTSLKECKYNYLLNNNANANYTTDVKLRVAENVDQVFSNALREYESCYKFNFNIWLSAIEIYGSVALMFSPMIYHIYNDGNVQPYTEVALGPFSVGSILVGSILFVGTTVNSSINANNAKEKCSSEQKENIVNSILALVNNNQVNAQAYVDFLDVCGSFFKSTNTPSYQSEAIAIIGESLHNMTDHTSV